MAQARVNEQVKADSLPGPVEADVDVAGLKEFVTAAACKAAGGRWTGGHDISGHVFLLVLGSAFLVQEVGWVVARHYYRRRSTSQGPGMKDERTVVMHDGAVKSAGTDLVADKRWDDFSPEMEEEREVREIREVVGGGGLWDALGHGGKVVLAVVGLSVWMLLMTAIYFHTWFEKVSPPFFGRRSCYTRTLLTSEQNSLLAFSSRSWDCTLHTLYRALSRRCAGSLACLVYKP